jgi:hypothetical protein
MTVITENDLMFPIHVIEILDDSDDEFEDIFVEVGNSPSIESLLDTYVDIAISSAEFIHDKVCKKERIPSYFVEHLDTQIDSAIIIFHSIPPEHILKRDFGAVLQDLKKQKFKLDRYMYKTKRTSSNRQAKIEAYQDPEIACYAELSKHGLKTRNKFYKR